MELSRLPVPRFFLEKYQTYARLTPIQEKAVQAGLLEGKSLLVCAPTASGKTLIATLAISRVLGTGKSLYVVPLKALAKEKYREYQKLVTGTTYKVALATGDLDAPDHRLGEADILILTTEKLDSLLRHRTSWMSQVKLAAIDEIHLLNDPSRGPVLEVILTLLRLHIQPQLIGLSATIGNPQELAEWLQVTLVQDSWRPVELKQGIMTKEGVKFYGKKEL